MEIQTVKIGETARLTAYVPAPAIPTFLWHSIDDPVVDAKDPTRFILALQEAGIECEYHLFDHGGHGLALANAVYAHDPSEDLPEIAQWVGMADRWMSRQRVES